jgi:hypothetical protein
MKHVTDAGYVWGLFGLWVTGVEGQPVWYVEMGMWRGRNSPVGMGMLGLEWRRWRWAVARRWALS